MNETLSEDALGYGAKQPDLLQRCHDATAWVPHLSKRALNIFTRFKLSTAIHEDSVDCHACHNPAGHRRLQS